MSLTPLKPVGASASSIVCRDCGVDYPPSFYPTVMTRRQRRCYGCFRIRHYTKRYGYPRCCVIQFMTEMHRSPEGMLPGEIRRAEGFDLKALGVDYVPCSACCRRLASEHA